MSRLGSSLAALRDLDAAAARAGPLAALDPRAKLAVALLFTVLVASFPRHEVSALVPFFLLPVAAASLGGVPYTLIGRALVAPLPFVLLVAVPVVVTEAGPPFDALGLRLPAGTATALSILLRFLLTASAALVLVATTGLANLAWGLSRLGVPDAFATQLLVLYRYLFVLGEEAGRMERARDLRSSGARGRELARAGPFLATLLLRSQERAERIDRALRARGFSGRFPALRAFRLGAREAAVTAAAASLLALFRFVDVPLALGRLLAGGAP